MRLLVNLLPLLAVVSSLVPTDVMDPSRVRSSSLRQQNLPRQLQTTVTTTACDRIRTTSFRAKLELEYYYLIETAIKLTDFSGIRNALVQAVLDALHSCDEYGYPEYALDLATRHNVAEEGFCIPQDFNNTCTVLRGTTHLYLDGGVNVARDMVYLAIQQALLDRPYIASFEPAVLFSRFLKSAQETLVMVPSTQPSNSSGKTPASVMVAIAVAVFAFVIASIFSYGFLRRQTALNARRQRITKAQLAAAQKKKKHRLHRQYFSQLREEEHRDGCNNHDNGSPVLQLATTRDVDDCDDEKSVGWSVSDITSDSGGSVRSTVSRTTSRLEKIEEEREEDHLAEADHRKEVRADAFGSYAAAYASHRSRMAEIMKRALDVNFGDSDDSAVGEEKSQEEDESSSFSAETLVPIITNSDSDDAEGFDRKPIPPTRKTLFHESYFTSDVTDSHYFAPQPTVGKKQNRPVVVEDEKINDSPCPGSNDSLQQWLIRLLTDLQMSQKIKRIEF